VRTEKIGNRMNGPEVKHLHGSATIRADNEGIHPVILGKTHSDRLLDSARLRRRGLRDNRYQFATCRKTRFMAPLREARVSPNEGRAEIVPFLNAQDAYYFVFAELKAASEEV
jgi:hypothetical protein